MPNLELDEATDEVVLYQNADVRRLNDLRGVLQQAMTDKLMGKGESARAGDLDPATEAGRAYDEFHGEALTRAIKVQIQAVGHRAWRELLLNHPPRPDVTDEAGEVTESFPQDHQVGFNVDTMGDDLVPASVVVEGQFDDPSARDAFIGKLSEARFNRVYMAAIKLNQDAGPDPKASASSMLGRMFSET